MFKTSQVDFKSAGTLNKLVSDYLKKNSDLRTFFGFFPDKQGFSELLKTKPYNDFDRSRLSEILLRQSDLVKNTTSQSRENILKFKNKNTYSVTTGHQLCLFTGPLYFIYKIFSAINLAESLKKEFPDYDFVPVYWMASEDHDFEEIRSFNSNGKKVQWESNQQGAVGDFKTEELKKNLPELREVFGISENANFLFKLFETAYLKHKKLSDATRYLVNELFGKYGLVTIDGDDIDFKQQLKAVLKKDVFDNSPSELVNKSIVQLESLGYHTQVKPRLINCFYLDDQVRARIEKNGNDYNSVGTEKHFTRSELEDIIDNQPQKISPNVLLRPVYQQLILPNLAYIGGPGELAYWLEFKSMFDSFGVNFPILMPRSFVSIVDRNVGKKIEELNFSEMDFFKTEIDLVKDFMVKRDQVFDLESEKDKINVIFSGVSERTQLIDKTLTQHVAAQQEKTLNKLNTIAQKTNRALKRSSEESIDKIRSVKQSLFPENMPQERFENFSSFYIQYGAKFFETLKNEIDPFELSHKILMEK
jgi:bacillithiol biosynthesis cysteine-adding enzyme BshC